MTPPLPSLALLALLAACTPKPVPPVDATSGATQAAEEDPVQAAARAFVTEHEQRLAPVVKEMNLAYWTATTQDDAEAYKKVGELELQARQLHADPETYAQLRTWRDSPQIGDPLLKRQLLLISNGFAANQMDAELMERIVQLGVEIEEIYNPFRGRIDGEEVSANQIQSILTDETDNARRQKAWEASKQVGPLVADKLRELVKLRNQAAKKAGYANFYEMRLILGEQDPATVERLFTEMGELSKAPFAQLKGEVDAVLAQRYGVEVAQLRPWHYADPFFQEAPQIWETDLDAFYQDRSIEELSTAFFAGIGMEVEGIIARSDLYPRDGKQPSAYCTDIDRQGDVRMLCNLTDDEYWMSTMLHELGHAVYDQYIDPQLPWTLRGPAHPFTTEAVAMVFGRLSKDPAWIGAVTGAPAEQVQAAADDARKTQRLLQLVFARWSMVMVEFERGLYQDPDADLQDLWWSLAERHQLLTRPAGREAAADWATKIHIVSYPAYYHNYLMGEMMASQVLARIASQLYEGAPVSSIQLAGQPAVGAYMKERIFAPGASLHWNQLILQATGEELTPRHFVAEYLESDQ